MTLTTNTVLAKNEEKFLSSDLGDEMVMMNLENGNYIGLNDVGRDIWEHIDGQASIAEMITKIVEEYDVSEEECAKDILEYLNEMHTKGLVIIK